MVAELAILNEWIPEQMHPETVFVLENAFALNSNRKESAPRSRSPAASAVRYPIGTAASVRDENSKPCDRQPCRSKILSKSDADKSALRVLPARSGAASLQRCMTLA